MKNSDPNRSGRLPKELSQNMAGIVPIRKKRLTALSPRMDMRPSERPNALMISGPNV